MKKKRLQGYILLEALVALAIMGFLVISILPSIGFLLQRSRAAAVNTDANLVLQQGMEVAYNVFSVGANWSPDTYPNGTYQVILDSTGTKPTWTLTPAPNELVQGKYTRTITIGPVYRDTQGKIQPSGDIDPRSKRVTVSVQWAPLAPISAQLLLINTQ